MTVMKQITAVMAGTVVEVLVKAGDNVAEGQDIAILESMKMQLPVSADASGIVKEIKIGPGDFVNEGDPLVIVD